MKIALCDDIEHYNKCLHGLLQAYFSNKNENSNMDIYTSGIDLLNAYKNGQYDLVFLDIDMPGIDGFQTAEQIRKIDRYVHIVFVTNESGQVFNSFHYNAKGYICKPVDMQDLIKLMDRILEEYHHRDAHDFYTAKIKSGGVMSIYLPDVLYFESSKNYVMAKTGKDTYTIIQSLEKLLGSIAEKGFVRISKHYVVNKAYVFQKFNKEIVLSTGDKLQIGRVYKDKLLLD